MENVINHNNHNNHKAPTLIGVETLLSIARGSDKTCSEMMRPLWDARDMWCLQQLRESGRYAEWFEQWDAYHPGLVIERITAEDMEETELQGAWYSLTHGYMRKVFQALASSY